MSFADNNTDPSPSIEELQEKLKQAQAKTAAAATVSEPEATEAVEGRVSESSPEANASTTGFQLSLPQAGGVDAMDAALDVVESGGNFIDFPVLTLTSGPTGGAFKAAPFVADTVADEMPEGSKAFPCVFMGYRVAGTAWPAAFGEGDDDKAKPVFNVAVGHHQADEMKLLTLAAKNYQFTKGEDKAKFDYDGSDSAAHIRPQLELLVYEPELDQLIVVQTCSHFSSMAETMKLLRSFAQLDENTGAKVYNPFPCKLQGASKETGKSRKWKIHWIDIDGDIQKDVKKMERTWEAYQQFVADNMANPEIRDNVTNWLSCSDRPMTDKIRTVLEATESI